MVNQIQKKIDDVAIMWNKTKDPYYKDLWYKLIKERYYGINNSDGRVVPFSSRHKRNDKGIKFSRTSWVNLL